MYVVLLVAAGMFTCMLYCLLGLGFGLLTTDGQKVVMRMVAHMNR